MSIHIGLNRVDPQEYGGWRGELAACEADALAMAQLAEAQGIATRALLLTSDATYARVMAELRQAVATLRCNDYLLLTFAGHGASFREIPVVGSAAATPAADAPRDGHEDRDDVPDEPDEIDGRDEAWCLHDTYVLDDELHDWYCKLAVGVRVCVVSDSCFSGTVTREGRRAAGPRRGVRLRGWDEPDRRRERRMAPRLADALYRRDFRSRYLPRSFATIASRHRQPGAQIVLLAGCQDDQTAAEGSGHGRFTEQLLAVWNGGRYAGSHRQLIDQIKARMPRRQQPNLFVCGKPDPVFLDSRPFTPAG